MATATRSLILFVPVLIWIALAGCATSPAPETDETPATMASQVQDRITPFVESLYLHTKELRQIYLDLRSVAQAHSFQGLDEQLNYIQKASLYIEKSLIGASHQWEFFSIMHDIRSAAIVDYFTLRHKGLGRAANEARYDVKFITVYQSQITNPVAKEDIDRALSVIAEIRTIYDELTTAIAPVARGGKPNQTL